MPKHLGTSACSLLAVMPPSQSGAGAEHTQDFPWVLNQTFSRYLAKEIRKENWTGRQRTEFKIRLPIQH